ncbi:MAG: hypothetical protein JNL83_15035 [Myxococcales bacterium]|nr:hypothetical protein [Myxococcales bacterium]
MRAALALLLVSGCWRGGGTATTPGARAPDEPTIGLCAELAFKSLTEAVMFVSGSSAAPAFDDAQAQAKHDVELADGAARTDLAAAARHYLACAARYRTVPDDDPLRDSAHYNATVCYENSMYAFAMAGRFQNEGKPALERAIRDDPRLAPELRRILASPPRDCAVQR